MAIFKRNKHHNRPDQPAGGAQVQPVRTPVPTEIESPGAPSPVFGETGAPAASADTASPIFTPVLSYAPEPGPDEAEEKIELSHPQTEIYENERNELAYISDIFKLSEDSTPTGKPASAISKAAESMSATQERWRDRRRKAMEKADAETAKSIERDLNAEDAAAVSGDAPIIASMQSVPEEVLKRGDAKPRIKPAQPVSLAFADLSGRYDLEPEEIEEATEIYGIKYPRGFKVGLVNYNGRAIDYSNFSLVEDLKWDYIKNASDITGVVFPSSFDAPADAFFGRSLRCCDFSAVYTLRWKHIEGADDIVALKYPATFDIQNANFLDRNISGSDFSLVSGLRWSMISNASDISGIKYPAEFDIENARFSGRDIKGSDFSLVEGLRWEHIHEASNIEGIVYPESFDFSEADFRGLSIKGSDFSRAKSFSFHDIGGAVDIRRLKYPECYDSALARYRGMDISGSNFSRVSTLRFAHIRDASDISRLVYPPQFDIDEADFTGRDIDYSDFSLLPGVNWDSIKLAESREGVIYPASFVEPQNTTDEVQGAMLAFLLKLYQREFRGEVNIDKLYNDISALYPGMDDTKAAELINGATERWKRPDGRLVELTAREAHIGDKLFMTKLGFKLLYPSHGPEVTLNMLREQFGGLFKKHEKERFEKRLEELSAGRYLSAAELSEIGYKPPAPKPAVPRPVQPVAAQPVLSFEPAVIAESGQPFPAGSVKEGEHPNLPAAAVNTDGAAAVQSGPSAGTDTDARAQDPTAGQILGIPEEIVEGSKVRTFGYVDPDVAASSAGQDSADGISLEGMPAYGTPAYGTPAYTMPDGDGIPAAFATPSPAGTPAAAADDPAPAETDASGNDDIFKPVALPTVMKKQEEQPEFTPPPLDRFAAKPVDLTKLRKARAAAASNSSAASRPIEPEHQTSSRRERLTDEEKGIRTGVMGMLLYIHENSSDEELSKSELFSEFMKIYPGSQPREAAAMAQFATNTLSGSDPQMRAKLFMFASKAPAQVKRKLLDFAYNEYVYRLSETADEEIFRDFLRALCQTLYDDSPDYEYSSYLRSRDILKDPPLRREPSYRRISFENNLGKANLYANAKYPFYRTLEQVGFAHYTFDAVRGSLMIEVSDNKYYEALQSLVYRERTPNLLQFVIIDTPMGYLYLEQRCIDDWQVTERDVWSAAERNMREIDMRAKYSFASSEFSSFRYIQHDLASYVLSMPDYLKELSCGQDIILSIPCREIVYIDFYDFGGIKKMLEFASRYNCTLIINGEEYEHPFSPDVFIYHAKEGTLERVNDETYILLGDSVARRQVLRNVLPLNVEYTQELLSAPRNTDEITPVSDEYCIVQEAVFTLLKLYAEMNGDTDYTIPENVMMAVVDELFITFDAVYPPARGREQPNPIDHVAEAAKMAMNGGKTLCWLMVQAIQYLCGDIKYETPSSAHIREEILETIYGANANAVWLNCATASDFTKRFESVRRFAEKPVDKHHLTILDSRLEVAMHGLTMIFHQFGNRYALGEVRRHLYRMDPETQFTYEVNQSAWLPSPGDDVDVDAQSLGMIFRGFDRAAQERILTAFANAIGDKDLSEGGWPLLYFIKFVKYSYLDPVEMVERYFVSRSRLIPSQTVLKQLYYKDLNNEFVKHSRRASRADSMDYDDSFEDRRAAAFQPVGAEDTVESVLSFARGFESSAGIPQSDPIGAFHRPDIQLTPVETGYLEKRLSLVLEQVDMDSAQQLREAAHYVTKVFHVPEVMFKTNDDIECELHYGIIRSREQITTLRSFAWTLASLIMEDGQSDMRDATEKDITRTVEIVEDNNRINYKPGTRFFPTLCGMPLDEGMYIPAHQEYLFFAQEIMPETKLASLFSLQKELMELAPAMKLCYDLLREQKRGEIMPPPGVLFDVLCAWSAFSFSAGGAFEVVKGPQMYNYNQIPR